MADVGDWSDSGSHNINKRPNKKQSGGPSDLLRVMYPASNLASLKRGGKVRKTGPVNVHKGERVIPAGKVKKVERMMKRKKMKMRASKRG